MKNVCMARDPECGIYVDHFGGSYVYPDTGMTLEQQFPDQFFRTPVWAAKLVEITSRLSNWAADVAWENRIGGNNDV